MKLFFDGVPDKNVKDSTIHTDTLTGSLNTINQTRVKADSGNIYYHPPFKDKACTTCHQAGEPGNMAHNQGGVCFSCHTNFSLKYNYVHGPVAAGECTACHFPHMADNKNLVRRNGQDLCLFCHTKSLVMKNDAHSKIGNSGCITCHNPHGGKNRTILAFN